MLGELGADEAAQCLSGQSLLVLQVAIGDQLSLGMLRKPALTMSEELFHFRITTQLCLSSSRTRIST